jgi:hypothetical protein
LQNQYREIIHDREEGEAMTYRRTDGPRLAELTPEQAIQELARYVDREFRTLEAQLKTPEVRGLQFETLSAIPARYKDGDLYYGLAGVFGGAQGLYLRDGGNWRKL